MGCCVCQLAYTIAQLKYATTRQANGWDVVYANWHTQQPIGIHNMPMGYCVFQLACCVCQKATVYANWHTQHPIHWPVVYANRLLCMQIGIHNIPSIGLLCMPIGIHNSPLAWLLCMPIAIHNSPLAWLLCMPIGIHNSPSIGLAVVYANCIHNNPLS